MTTQIKITQLVDIGANLATTTLLPVVNMSGMSTTQKTNLGNLGNVILQGAGTTWKPAALANLAYSVVNAAQPNITSVGTLSVNTLKISGGSSGQVLRTDGAGNLSWVAQSGGGNANTGDIGFDNNVIYSNIGVVINNSDLTNGQTAGMSIPIQGDGNAASLYNTYGNVTLLAGNIGNSQNVQTWSFGADGNLRLPDGTILQKSGGIQYPVSPEYEWDLHSSDGKVYIGSVDNMAYIDTYDANISVRLRANENDWIFGADGNLTLPRNTFAVNYANGTPVTLGTPAGNSGAAQFNWQGTFSNQGGTPGDTYSTLQFDSNGMPTLNGTNAYQQRVNNFPYMQILAPRVESTDFGIVAGPALTLVGYDDTYNTPRSAYLSVQDQANATQQWDFGILGNGNNNFVISDRTNSNQWTFGGDGTLTTPGISGNITGANVIEANTFLGTGNLKLQPNPSNTDAYLDVYLTTGPDIHIASNSENLILGKDSGANIVVGIDGNVSIRSDSGTAYNWRFDNTGNTVLPGLLVAQASDNGSIVFSNNGADVHGSLKVDGGYNMIVSTDSNFYVKRAGSDRLAITDTDTDLMASSNVVIHANKAGSEFNWIFDTSGNLTIPGGLVGGGASPAPYISGFDSISSITLSASGNATAGNVSTGNLDLSGNINFTNNSAVQQGSIIVNEFRTIETVTLSANSQNNASLLTLEDTGNVNLRAWQDINLNTYTQTTNNNFNFGASGNLTIPGNISGSGSNGLMISSNGNVTLNSKGAQFIFDAPAGNFYLPNPGGAIVFADNSVQNTAYTGAVLWSTAPGSANTAGTAGQIAYDAGGNLFVCVATNTWSKFSGNITW